MSSYVIDIVMSRFLFFNLVNNLNIYVNYYFIITIVPEKPQVFIHIHSSR